MNTKEGETEEILFKYILVGNSGTFLRLNLTHRMIKGLESLLY